MRAMDAVKVISNQRLVCSEVAYRVSHNPRFEVFLIMEPEFGRSCQKAMPSLCST